MWTGPTAAATRGKFVAQLEDGLARLCGLADGMVALGRKTFDGPAVRRQRFAELISVSYKFGFQRLDIALRVKRLGAELGGPLISSAARVPSQPFDLVGGFTN